MVKEQTPRCVRLRNCSTTSHNVSTTSSPRPEDSDPEVTKELEEMGFENPEQLSDEYRLEELVSITIAKLSPSDLKPMGHQFDDMVYKCTWRGVDCKANYTQGKYWTSFWHYRFGNCFVFNPSIGWNRNTRSRLHIYRTGPLNGLQLQLNIQQEEYIDQITKRAGAMIQVFPFGQMPFPEERGTLVAPGFSTDIGLEKMDIKRVDPHNNGSCVTDEASINTENIFKQKFNTSYSKTACVLSCLAYHQMHECKCMEYRFPTDSVCDTLNSTIVECLAKVKFKLSRNELGCSTACGPACREEAYRLTSSFAVWPSQRYQNSIIDNLFDGIFNYSRSWFRDNYLEVNIFFKELNYDFIEESVAYELVNFLSDIGGQLGLWVGVSVMTGAEVVELALLIFFKVFCRKPRKVTVNSEGDPEPNVLSNSQLQLESIDNYKYAP
ncbi:amiloride-sensitive sodium channel subunit beta isoform X2 [Nematostella vectensis]|nr:amiloride-sensitive sodium channel subunit beta isoform X2 [Nematostella vectensis]